MLDDVEQKIGGPEKVILNHALGDSDEKGRSAMIEIPRDVFNNLVGFLKGIPQDVTRLLDRVKNIENQSTVQTPISFPKFAALPPELRLKVWEFAYRNPRVVGVEFHHKMCRHLWKEHSFISEEHICTYIAQATPKATLLEVSAEARSVALKESISLIPSSLEAIEKLVCPNIRFNLEHDILWVLGDFFCVWNPDQVVEEATTRVAVNENMWPGWDAGIVENLQRWFPYLEELIFVVGAEVGFRYQDVKLERPTRQPWQHDLLGVDLVDSKTTWLEVEVGAKGKLTRLMEERQERIDDIFADIGIDPDKDHFEDIDGIIPLSLWEWYGVHISYREIVPANNRVTSVVKDNPVT